ncbi:hypothetical protein AK812_SmicGene34501 [Symbiodinium microadriaticum]|uniref:Uncharacterized protein n=1 Tax=Symbiodinium microadriaticum TaxID=2951 RepID=A0A1Q9CNV4_SYMMI|nr:hypothetical protein AK812_SmicGene34501 [Symbiodinium microadriaticum]
MPDSRRPAQLNPHKEIRCDLLKAGALRVYLWVLLCQLSGLRQGGVVLEIAVFQDQPQELVQVATNYLNQDEEDQEEPDVEDEEEADSEVEADFALGGQSVTTLATAERRRLIFGPLG